MSDIKPLMEGCSDATKAWAIDCLTILVQEEPRISLKEALIITFEHILEQDAKAKEVNART